MEQDKQQVLLDRVNKDYPIGTEFIALYTDVKCKITTGIFKFTDEFKCVNEFDNMGEYIKTNDVYHCIYDEEKNKWASIIVLEKEPEEDNFRSPEVLKTVRDKAYASIYVPKGVYKKTKEEGYTPLTLDEITPKLRPPDICDSVSINVFRELCEQYKESHCKHLNMVITDLNKELEFKNNSIHTYKNQLSAKIDETAELRSIIEEQKKELDKYKRSIEVAQWGCPPYPARANELIGIITVEKTGFVSLESFMEFGPHEGKTLDEVDLEMKSIEIKGLVKYIQELEASKELKDNNVIRILSHIRGLILDKGCSGNANLIGNFVDLEYRKLVPII